MRLDTRLIAVAVAASAGLAACGDSTAPAAGQPMTVSFSTAAEAGSSASLASLEGGTAAATDSIRITKAQIVVSRIELQRSGASCTGAGVAGDDDSDKGDDTECPKLELSPVVVDLPVDASVVSKLKMSIPSGNYSSLEAKIGPVKSNKGQGSSAFLAKYPDLVDVSVRVEGTFNGKAFTYRGSPRVELKNKFDPPIVVDSGGINLTINVDLRSWFRNRSGGYVDPSTASVNGSTAALVADNIRRSFKAFRDDNRNGRDDRDERGHRG